MVTCRQIMELDIFYNVKLIAGNKGLDKAISWVYPKHTKVISPWVRGGELLLVSGYEYGMNEKELLNLLEESCTNKLSGILIEGGINFKDISGQIIKKADEIEVPLFFINGVISFLDITRDISRLIMENKIINQNNNLLLDSLLNSSPLTKKKVNQFFCGTGISPNCNFSIGVFGIFDNHLQLKEHSSDKTKMIFSVLNDLQQYIDVLFEKLDIIKICKINPKSVDYLLYSDNKEYIYAIEEELKKINIKLNSQQDNLNIYLSFSSITNDGTKILNIYQEAYFTQDLLNKRFFPGMDKKFCDTGSYQLIFHIKDSQQLILYRDKFLKKLYEADKEGSPQLLETLNEFLIQNGNMLQTSKKMFIHRNTLHYRMEQIKSITNKDIIGDFNIRRDFLNAFLILDMFPFSK